MPAVGSRIEQRVRRPALDAAFERGFERFVACIAGIERKIVAEDENAARRGAHERHQCGQRLDVFAVNLDEDDTLRTGLGRNRAVHGFHKRAFPHAARAPKEGVVGGKAAGEPPRVVEKRLALRVDAFKSAIGTAATAETGASVPSVCHTKAFAAFQSGARFAAGAKRSSASAMRASKEVCGSASLVIGCRRPAEAPSSPRRERSSSSRIACTSPGLAPGIRICAKRRSVSGPSIIATPSIGCAVFARNERVPHAFHIAGA